MARNQEDEGPLLIKILLSLYEGVNEKGTIDLEKGKIELEKRNFFGVLKP